MDENKEIAELEQMFQGGGDVMTEEEAVERFNVIRAEVLKKLIVIDESEEARMELDMGNAWAERPECDEDYECECLIRKQIFMQAKINRLDAREYEELMDAIEVEATASDLFEYVSFGLTWTAANMVAAALAREGLNFQLEAN